MIPKSDTLAAIVRVVLFGGRWWFGECRGLWGNDEFQRYVQRDDRMTMTGGDAKEVNAMAHIPTPWPRGVNDRRIVSDSAHMQRVLEWYRRSARRPDPMPEVSLPDTPMGEKIQPEKQQGGGGAGDGGGGGGGGGGAAPAPY
jgi:uncharacterized membrane protein YgcG